MSAYAIYTRQSRVRNDITLSSCDVQFQICRDHADALMPMGCTWCGKRFDDPGEIIDRPALRALLAEAEAEAISHVVVYRLDRLSRRLVDTVRILDTFKQHGIELRIVTAQDLGGTAGSQFMLNILASFAEFEHSLISERIKESIQARRPATGKRQSLELPLKGKVFCAKCGRVMSPHVLYNRHNPHIRYVHYRCRSHAGGRSPCKAVSVPAAQLRLFILDIMRDKEEFAADPDLTPEARQASTRRKPPKQGSRCRNADAAAGPEAAEESVGGEAASRGIEAVDAEVAADARRTTAGRSNDRGYSDERHQHSMSV